MPLPVPMLGGLPHAAVAQRREGSRVYYGVKVVEEGCVVYFASPCLCRTCHATHQGQIRIREVSHTMCRRLGGSIQDPQTTHAQRHLLWTLRKRSKTALEGR